MTVLSWLTLPARSASAKDVAILAPRHEAAVLRRTNPKAVRVLDRPGGPGRLDKITPKALQARRIVPPGTLLRWHQRPVAAEWRQRSWSRQYGDLCHPCS